MAEEANQKEQGTESKHQFCKVVLSFFLRGVDMTFLVNGSIKNVILVMIMRASPKKLSQMSQMASCLTHTHGNVFKFLVHIKSVSV